MPVTVSINKLRYRNDSQLPPIITISGATSGLANYGFLKIEDWLYFAPSINPYNWLPPNRTMKECVVVARKVESPALTTGTGVANAGGNVTRTSGTGWEGAYNGTNLSSSVCSVEGKTASYTLTAGISLQSGTINHDYTNAAVEHAVLFGQQGVASIYELGSLIKTFSYALTDKVLIERTEYSGGRVLVRYYRVSASGAMTLIRTTRSKITDPATIRGQATVYNTGAQIQGFGVFSDEQASVSIELVGVLQNFQEWNNELAFASSGDSIQMADSSTRWTYANKKRVLRGLQLSQMTDRLTDAVHPLRQDLLDFFYWHKNEKDFIFVDNARPDSEGNPTEWWARFANPLTDKTTNRCKYTHGTAIIESFRDDFIKRELDTAQPAQITDLDVDNIFATGYTLFWTTPTDNVGVIGFEIEIDGVVYDSANLTGFETSSVGFVSSYQVLDGQDGITVTSSTVYEIRVRAYDAAGNRSNWSDVLEVTTSAGADVTAPSVPGIPTFASVTSTSMTTNWTASTDNIAVTGYELQRATNSGFSVNLQTFTLGNVLTHNETSLTASTTYYFRVRARDAAGNWSAYSAIASQATGAPDVTAPSAPGLNEITGGNIEHNQIIIDWEASTDNVAVAGYQIQRAKAADWSIDLQIFTTTDTFYTHTGLTAETKYFFRVRAYDAAANYSAWSNTESATTDEAPAVSAVFVIDGDSRFRQSYYDASPAGTNLTDQVETLLTGVASVANIAVGGGALDTGTGDFNLTASLNSRLGSLFDGDETYKILIINSSYNDLFHNITAAAYMTKLQGYVTEGYAQGATHVIVFSPSESDYIGQRADTHAKNRQILELLRTEFAGSTPFGNANTRYINISSDNVIGLGADTHNLDLYFQGGADLGKLHYAEGHNVVNAPYLAEMVKRIVGTVTIPSIPSGLKVTTISDTEIEITVDPAADGIAVTSRSYRLNGGSAVSMGIALTVTVGSLAAGTEYDVEVRATNGSGSSGWSPAKTVWTHPDFTGWTPASLTAIWLRDVFEDTAQTTPATSADDPVKAFKDASGTDHFTEATNNPVLKIDSIGYLNGIYFDGTNDKLSNATAGSLFVNDFTWIIPVKASTPGFGTNRAIAQAGDLTNREARSLMIFAYSGFFAFVGYGDISSPGVNLSTEIDIADGQPHLLTCRKTGTLVELYIDKVLIVTGRPDLAAFTSGIMRLAAFADDTAFYQGHLGESVLVPSSLSELNLHRAHNYLTEKITVDTGGGWTLLPIHDTFTGTNGDNLHGRTPDTVSNGHTWQVVEGAVFIYANQAQGDNSNPSTAFIEVESPNYRFIAKHGDGSAYTEMVVRYSDLNNFILAFFSGSTVQFYKRVAGVDGTVGGSPACAITTGDDLELRPNGNTIEVYVNNVLKHSLTDSFNNTATKCAIRSIAGTRWNDCRVIDI